MPKLLEAAITDADLERLVCEHRDNAGKAQRLHSKPVDAERYANVQNGWADIFQELLDRRRHFVLSSTPSGVKHNPAASLRAELAMTLSKPR
jgi:hypothetical protein